MSLLKYPKVPDFNPLWTLRIVCVVVVIIVVLPDSQSFTLSTHSSFSSIDSRGPQPTQAQRFLEPFLCLPSFILWFTNISYIGLLKLTPVFSAQQVHCAVFGLPFLHHCPESISREKAKVITGLISFVSLLSRIIVLTCLLSDIWELSLHRFVPSCSWWESGSRPMTSRRSLSSWHFWRSYFHGALWPDTI